MEHKSHKRNNPFPLEPQSKSLERENDLFEPLLDISINQVTVTIKLLWRLECLYEELRLVNEMEVQENTDLAQVVLRPAPAKTSSSTDNRTGFVSPAVLASRCPVNGILQGPFIRNCNVSFGKLYLDTNYSEIWNVLSGSN